MKGIVIMANWKAVLGIMAFLACAAVILWSIDTYTRPSYQCGEESVKLARRTHDVLVKYLPMIMRLPHNPEPGPEFLRDENGDLTNTWGIVIFTDEEIDNNTLPSEHRIPDSLDGVPVQVLHKEIGDKKRPWYPGWRPDDRSSPHSHYKSDVANKNQDLFYRYPFYRGRTSFSPVPEKGQSKNDNRDPVIGIQVQVREMVDPNALPPEDRIPDCLEDVPVRISVSRK